MCDDSCAANAPRSFWSVQGGGRGGRGGGGGGDIVPTAKCTAEGLHLQVKNKHLSLRDVI